MQPTPHARIVTIPENRPSLDTMALQRLESTFREWVEMSRTQEIRRSRTRVLIIFLLIRYTGARLNEVLHFDPRQDIAFDQHTVTLRKPGAGKRTAHRTVRIPAELSVELRGAISELEFEGAPADLLRIDPAHVRRKFYDRAEAVGLPREMGTPEAIRKSRAVELMQGNLPLPVVQKIMGHSTPNLAASYVHFSEEEIRQVERLHIERESARKTSARNVFYGKIERLKIGDVQSVLEIVTPAGFRICAVITNDSRSRLGLNPGALVAAEVKAPHLMLAKGDQEPRCSAENRFHGEISRLLRGKVTMEVIVRLSDGTELCAVTVGGRGPGIAEGEKVWVLFNAFAVVLHLD
jgi:molybdate transport system regulatory protein